MLGLVMLVFCGAADSLAPSYRVVREGPVRVEVRVVRPRGRPLTIGDRLVLEVLVRHPKGLAVSAPFFEEPERQMILESRRAIRLVRDTAFDSYRMTVAVFAVGVERLAPVMVTYQDAQGVCAAVSDSLPVRVQSLLSAQQADIHDLKPQVEFPNPLVFWMLGAGLALGAAGYLGYRLRRRYRANVRVESAPVPPWDEALAALDAVPVAELLSTGQLKRYYYTVSEIIKRYLTRRFDFPALDSTTSEILRELRQRRLPAVDRFGAFFLDADLVKYSKYVPAEPERLVEHARELVRLTTPTPAMEQTAPDRG